MTKLNVDDIVRLLDLRPLPEEGGLFRETYRSANALDGSALPASYRGPRSLATAIYYLITPELFSAMHRVRGDEVFHFYFGDPVEMLQLRADGTGERLTLGSDVALGMRPQVVVAGGVWQGSRLRPGGSFALLGATMAPGFDVADFEIGQRMPLVRRYPDFAEEIARLTRGE
ncbi:MAG TPA: cupin domain-containing protein [Candidatus Krumholzibacteria bacterium]|nr:cupin domain-containing protein [Candidatus Krumholzibacteria bacterium]